MTARLLLPLLLLLLLHSPLCNSADWSYRYTGSDAPSNWAVKYSNMCSGRKQSPIQLDKNLAVEDSLLKPYNISMPNVAGQKYKLKNHGNYMTLQFSDLLINVSLDAHSCYRPLSMHWHWGSVSSRGSEHWLNGRQLPIEGHIVMWNCRFYSSFEEALGSPSGIAVLGVLYEQVADTDPTATTLTTGFRNVLDLIDNVSICSACRADNDSVATSVSLDAFDLTQLLPSDTSRFFVYEGSLTTPPCLEGLLWTVFDTPIRLRASDLEKFRRIRFANGDFMYDNFRPPQALNPRSPVGPQRLLTRSFRVDPQPAAAATARVSDVVMATVAFLACSLAVKD